MPYPIPTNTPAATPTPVPSANLSRNGRAEPARRSKIRLAISDCTNVRWDVDNIKAVYFEGQGVAGHDSRQVCPGKTTTFTLLVIMLDGTRQPFQITIDVGGESAATVFANRAKTTRPVLRTVWASRHVRGVVQPSVDRCAPPTSIPGLVILWYPNGANFWNKQEAGNAPNFLFVAAFKRSLQRCERATNGNPTANRYPNDHANGFKYTNRQPHSTHRYPYADALADVNANRDCDLYPRPNRHQFAGADDGFISDQWQSLSLPSDITARLQSPMIAFINTNNRTGSNATPQPGNDIETLYYVSPTNSASRIPVMQLDSSTGQQIFIAPTGNIFAYLVTKGTSNTTGLVCC